MIVAGRDNERSIAVMRRLGMEFIHETEIEEEGERFNVALYAVCAEQWRTRTRAEL